MREIYWRVPGTNPGTAVLCSREKTAGSQIGRAYTGFLDNNLIFSKEAALFNLWAVSFNETGVFSIWIAASCSGVIENIIFSFL